MITLPSQSAFFSYARSAESRGDCWCSAPAFKTFGCLARCSPIGRVDAGGVGGDILSSTNPYRSLSAAIVECIPAMTAYRTTSGLRSPKTGCMRVLVVDDNRDAAFILSRLLRLSGHEPRVATDGEQALQIAAEFLPEAVLLDIDLPKIDGYAVAKSLRGIPGLSAIRIVLISGLQANTAKTAECGADRHLLKPAAIEDVLYAIGAGPPPVA